MIRLVLNTKGWFFVLENAEKTLNHLKKEKDELENQLLKLSKKIDEKRSTTEDLKELKEKKRELERSYIELMARLTQLRFFAGEKPLFSK